MTEKPSTPPRLPIIHSVYTKPERPIAGSLFKLIIEGKNFQKDVRRLLFYTKPWDMENREDRLRSKIFIEKCVYLPTVRYVERSKKGIMSLELIKESGIYHVTINSPVEGDNPFNPYDRTITVEDPLALREASEGQKRLGAGGEAKPVLLSIETTLFYNSTTGKFRFKTVESLPISKNPGTKVRDTAKKLMKWWKKGEPCPMSEFVKDATKKTPQWMYENISDIRKTLKSIKVNIPQATSEGYPRPDEPQNFLTES